MTTELAVSEADYLERFAGGTFVLPADAAWTTLPGEVVSGLSAER